MNPIHKRRCQMSFFTQYAKITGLLLMLELTTSAQTVTVFQENFEQPQNIQFNNLKITSDSPGEGRYSAHLSYPVKPKSEVALAAGRKIIEVKPDTWYKMKVRHKNNIKIGEVKFGLIESRSAKERKVAYHDWRWKAIPLNITEWKTYEMEFKTASNTHGVQLYLRTENGNSGSSWWDDISIVEFNKVFDPIEIKSFPAAGSFTDIPTRRAYMITKGDPLQRAVRQRNTTYHWETLDLGKEKLCLEYRDLPKGSSIESKLVRGRKNYFSEIKNAEGSGKLDYSLKLDALPEGIYLFQTTLTVGGKKVCTKEKEIWRINSGKSATPKHEPIIKSSTGQERQRQINGKNYALIYASAAPTWGLLSHHRQYCKPDLTTYIKTMQEQFGQDVFSVWYWRGPQWDDKRGEFLKEGIKKYREHLDFLAANNCYGRVRLEFAAHKKEPLNFDEIRQLVRVVKDHPALLEWHLDEPEIQKYTPEDMIRVYRIIKEEDPNHIVSINLCDPAKFHLYAPSSDIASYDIYPFPGTSLLENRKRTIALLKAFPNAPFDSYLQMFNFNTLEMPTFDQIRATFILDRINGSHSLIAYAWGEFRKSFLTDPELQSYYRAIVSMFRRLEPVLSNGIPRRLELNSTTGHVPFRALDYQGETIILMVNISPDTPADVTFSHPVCEAEDFFDSAWKYKGSNGKFTFRLKPVETKVIRLSNH